MQDAIHLDDDTVSRLLSGMRDALFGRRHPHRQGGPGSMPSAWIRQDPEQVEKVGTEKASWYCHWLEPGRRQRCKSCGPGERGKALAEELKLQIERDLTLGTYEPNANRAWAEFRREYEAKVLPGRAADTQRRVRRALDTFERIATPHKMAGIRTKTLDDYAAARRLERVKRRKGEAPLVAPGTVAQELSDLKAVLRVARRWGYLTEMPETPHVKLPRKLPRYVTPEHFAALYLRCDDLTYPRPLQGYGRGDWWRALLAFVYVATGWRIGQCLGLLWEDVDLAAGTVVGRHGVTGNKADRDVLVRLHPVAVEHLERLGRRCSPGRTWGWNCAGSSPGYANWPGCRGTAGTTSGVGSAP
jgi:integrase